MAIDSTVYITHTHTHTFFASVCLPAPCGGAVQAAGRYLEGQAFGAGEVGEDGDGRQRDQDGPHHVARDPAGDHLEQGAGTAHHRVQVEDHPAGPDQFSIGKHVWIG